MTAVNFSMREANPWINKRTKRLIIRSGSTKLIPHILVDPKNLNYDCINPKHPRELFKLFTFNSCKHIDFYLKKALYLEKWDFFRNHFAFEGAFPCKRSLWHVGLSRIGHESHHLKSKKRFHDPLMCAWICCTQTRKILTFISHGNNLFSV